jgi:primosomal replication protein N
VTENCLVISGEVAKAPSCRTSPAGIAHCQFYVRHNSLQMEAGFSRQAHCYLAVVVSGERSQQFALNLTQGMQVRVSGFLTMHKTRNGLDKLVLHANEIEMI